jgi:hypothetical protein
MNLIYFSIIAACAVICGYAAPPTMVPATGSWRAIFQTTADIKLKHPPYEADDPVRNIWSTQAEWERERNELNARPGVPAKLYYAPNQLAYFTFMADDLEELSAPASIDDLQTLVTCAFSNAILQSKSLSHWQSICAADYTAAVSQGKLGPLFCWEEQQVPPKEGVEPVFHESGSYRWPVLWPIPTRTGAGVAREASGKWECVITGVLEHSGVFTAMVSITRFSLDPAFEGYIFDTSIARDLMFFQFPISFVEESGKLKLRDIGGPNPTEEQVEHMEKISILLDATSRSAPSSYPLGLREHLPALISQP